MRHEVLTFGKTQENLVLHSFFRNFMSLRVMKLGCIRENSKYLF